MILCCRRRKQDFEESEMGKLLGVLVLGGR
jgi:hypothetical protein